jgi:glycosyltransferase involved in cell wall biosynthesis
MISGRDFIVIADEWDGHPTCTSHLFRQISRHARVFWLTTVNRMPCVNWGDAQKTIQTLAGWGMRRFNARATGGKPGSSAIDGPHVVAPIMVPWFKPWGRRFNCRSLLRAYHRIASEYNIVDPIIVTMFPSAVDFMKAVNCPLKVYYCVDEWLELPGIHRRDWELMENELLDHADALIVTSRDLERKGRSCCPIMYLPHGVDIEHFSRDAINAHAIPRLSQLRRPIVGFFGVIGEWVDLDLVATMARTNPEVSFVLIGKSIVSMGLVAKCSNVHYLGAVPYAELPSYGRHFDVGLIPFTVNRLTKAVNPLKLMEYYALGLPVLATRLPELEIAPGPAELASNAQEFCDKLGAILSHEGDHYRPHALEVARRNTWQERAEQFSAFVESLLSEGHRSASAGAARSCPLTESIP